MTEFELDIQKEGNGARITIHGDLDLDTSGELYSQLQALARDSSVQEAVVDFSELGFLHSAGIATLSLGTEIFEDAGKKLVAENVNPSHEESMQMMPAHLGRKYPQESSGFFQRTGDTWFELFEEFLRLNELAFDTIKAAGMTLMGRRKMPKGGVVEQAVLMGVDAFFIIALMSFLLGLILAFQSAYQLRQFGANIYVANLVGVSMVREFGPLITGIMLAGRSGSAIAAELGTMTVQEEVDALKTMGLDPLSYLVLPRVVAMVIVQPMLTLMSDFIGIFGGMIIAMTILDFSGPAYIEQTIKAVTFADFMNGLSKSVVFAMIISFIGCYTGLSIKGGASGVGRATTRAVVASIFLIILADSLYTMVTTVGAFL